jgi:hypothetical protein
VIDYFLGWVCGMVCFVPLAAIFCSAYDATRITVFQIGSQFRYRWFKPREERPAYWRYVASFVVMWFKTLWYGDENHPFEVIEKSYNKAAYQPGFLGFPRRVR